MAKKHTIITLMSIILIATLTQISTDIYTPSLPAIAHDLHTTLGQSQLTMAFFMAGIAITTLIYGPISEGIGRRWTIVIGIGIALIGTLLCLLANNIHALQAGRFIQGCGLGACNALWRTIFRDRFSAKQLAQIGSYLVNIFVLSVILAPFAGGYFQEYLGWRATFIFLFVWMIVVMCFILFFFKETSEHHGSHRLNIEFIIKAYRELLTNRIFMGFSFMVFFSYGGLFTWLTAGPVVLIHGIGISPVMYGYLMICTGLSTGVGGYVNAKLTKRMALKSIILLAISLMTFAGAAMIISYYLFGLNIYTVLIPAVIFIFGTTFMFMNGFALAFENVGHIAGYAGSLYACIQLLGGVLFSSILGHLNTNNPLPMASMFLASGVAAFVIYIGFAKQAASKT